MNMPLQENLAIGRVTQTCHSECCSWRPEWWKRLAMSTPIGRFMLFIQQFCIIPADIRVWNEMSVSGDWRARTLWKTLFPCNAHVSLMPGFWWYDCRDATGSNGLLVKSHLHMNTIITIIIITMTNATIRTVIIIPTITSLTNLIPIIMWITNFPIPSQPARTEKICHTYLSLKFFHTSSQVNLQFFHLECPVSLYGSSFFEFFS